MKRKRTCILLCILLCISLVAADALPLFAMSQVKASISASRTSAARDEDMNGEYIVSVSVDGYWQEAGRIGYDMFLSERSLDLSGYLAENSTATVRIIQEGGEAAQLDSVFLGGETPQSVDCDNGLYLMKLSKKDLDTISMNPDGIELVFPSNRKNDILSVTGRIEGKTISKEPFKFPSSNNYKPIIESSEFYTYELDSVRKELSLDGRIDEVADLEPLFKVFCTPGTGHPEGYTYGWVMNDDKYLYAVIDFTPDNTMDGDKDYSKVYVKTNNGIKDFKSSVSETTWGQPCFIYTDKVGYQHKAYEFKIPLEEISGDGSHTMELAFSAYGTAALFYADVYPDIAFNADVEEYLVVYEGMHNGYGIYGRFSNENAEWIDDPFKISNDLEKYYPQTDAIYAGMPVIAYDSHNSRFLVVWKTYLADYMDSKLIGQFLDADGNPDGESFLISDLYQNTGAEHSITYNADSSEFMIVWEDRDSYADTTGINIYGRFIDYDHDPQMYSIQEISVDDEDQRSPSVAYSTYEKCYLVAWVNPPEANSGNAIYGCLLKNGSLLKNNILVSTSSTNLPNVKRKSPSVTYHSKRHQFAVAWADSRDSKEGDEIFNIYGSYVTRDASGMLPGSEKLLSHSNEYDMAENISLEYNAYWNELGAVWYSESKSDGAPNTFYLLSGDFYDDNFGYGGELIDYDAIRSANPAIAANTNYFSFVAAYSKVGYGNYNSSEVGLHLIGNYNGDTPKMSMNPALAYDPEENNYLLVYSNTEYHTPTLQKTAENPSGETSYKRDLGIVGQFIGNKAEAQEGPFLISEPNATNLYKYRIGFPDAAYGDDKYLVVWLEQDKYAGQYSTDAVDIMGSIIDNEGNSYTGGAFPIVKNACSVLVNPYSVRLNATYSEDGIFLVTYSDGDNIFGRTVELDKKDNKTPLVSKNSINICTTAYMQFSPSTSYSPETDTFLVVWQEDNYSDTNLYGRLLNRDGTAVDSASGILEICTSANYQSEPSAAYNSKAGCFAVTWCELDTASGKQYIMGRHFSTDGLPIETSEKLIQSSTGGTAYQEFRHLSTVYNPTVYDEYFTVYYTLMNDGESYYAGGKGQHISNELASAGTVYDFGKDVYNNNSLCERIDIACNTIDGNYLVAYPCINEEFNDAYSDKDANEGNDPTQYGGYIKWELIGDVAPESPGKLQFKANVGNTAEYHADEGATVNVAVERVDGSSGPAAVKYRIKDDSTAAADDYSYTGDTVNFADKDTAPKFITINLKDDQYDEDEEFISLELYEFSGAVQGALTTAKVFINDTDIPQVPYFSFTDSSYSVAEDVYAAGVGSFKDITVKYTEPYYLEPAAKIDADQTVVAYVYYKTSDGTAKTADKDYEKAEGVLMFTGEDYDSVKGCFISSFRVPILDDEADEANEYVILTLSEPSKGAVINSPNPVNLTILDDDEKVTPPNPPTEHKDKSGNTTTPVTAAPVVEAPPPTEGLPDDALVDRMPGYIAISIPTKINEIKNEITLSYKKDLLAANPKHDARIYYWNPGVSKWVALATYPDGDSKVKAINDGGYKGWFVVFGVMQPHFSDVSSSWAEQIINRMNGLGLVEGYEVKGSDLRVARPDQKVTRAEFTMFVARIMNMNPDNMLLPALPDNEVENILSQSYSDAAEIAPWARTAVAKATKAGLIPFKGKSFMAQEPITRIEAGVMISRALKKFKDFKAIDLTSFKDSSEIPGWAVGEVVENALTGYPDNTLKPNVDIARAESLSMLLRLFVKGLGW